MKKSIKILGKVFAMLLALIIGCSSFASAFAATSWATGSRGSQSLGISWKTTMKYSYKDAQGKTHNVQFTNGLPFKIHYFAKSGKTLSFADDSQRAFCIEPDKGVELTGTGSYNSNTDFSGINAYSKQLTAAQQNLLNLVIANGYGNYRPTGKGWQNYWYATQLLVFESVSGIRSTSDFKVVSGKNAINPTTYLTASSSAETTVSDIQSAYNNIVTWVQISLNRPSGTATSESGATTYTMSYNNGVYTYVLNDTSGPNNEGIIRTSYADRDDGIKLSQLNTKASDITVNDSNVKVTIANKKLTFTSSSPLTKDVTVKITNSKVRGLSTVVSQRTGSLSIITASGGYQAFARGATLTAPVSYLKLTTPKMKLQLQKSSSNEDITKDNSQYSLAGARYDIYTDKACTKYFGYIVTDESGYGHYGNGSVVDGKNQGADVPAQTYYAKEVEAPPGYEINNNNGNPFEFTNSGKTVDGSLVYSFSCADKPVNDPMYVFIKKVDAVSGFGNADLAGAQFRINYYDGLYETADEVTNLTPLRSWVFATDEDGYIAYRDKYLVGGDSLYVNEQGYPCLPTGTVSIQEITAPTSGKYKINDTIFVRQVDRLAEVNADLEPINPFVVNEVPNTSGLTIKKTSSDGVVKSLWFRVESDNGYSEDYEITADSGIISVTDLDVYNESFELINYTVTELGVKNADGTYSIPRRYTPDNVSQVVTLDSDTNVEVSFNNATPVGQINLTKTSDDNEISYIYFRLTGTNGLTKTARTNTSGKVSFTNLPVFDTNDNYVTYTIDELGVKVGNDYEVSIRYIKPNAQTVVFTNATVAGNNVKDVTFNNVVKKGNLKITKTSDDNVNEGVAFRVQSTSTGYDKRFLTDSNGVIEVKDLPIYDASNNKIKYTVWEEGVYDSESGEYVIAGYYFNPDEQIVELDADTSKTVSVNFHNALRSLNLEVVKTATDDKVSGVWFNVKASDGSVDKNIVTGSNGKANLQNLYIYNFYGEPITYTVTELGIKQNDNTYVLPSRYKVLPSESFIASNFATTSADDAIKTATLDFFNEEIKANLEIIKTADDGKVSGIWFSVTASNGIEIENKATNANGKITYSNLPVYDDNNSLIRYTVTELGERQLNGSFKIPFRYNAIQPQTVTLNHNETTTVTNTVSFNNTLKTGSVTVTKLLETGDPMANVTFQLYKSDDTFVDEKVTTANGIVKFEELEQRDYYIVETKTDSEHNLLKNKVSFSIKGDNEETLNPTMELTNTIKPTIPNTGGTNGVVSIVIGAVLVLVAGVIAIVLINKKKKSREDGHRND